jgi:hypothetical protein
MAIGLMAITATAIVPTATTAIGAMAITVAIGLIVDTGRAAHIEDGANRRAKTNRNFMAHTPLRTLQAKRLSLIPRHPQPSAASKDVEMEARSRTGLLLVRRIDNTNLRPT